MSSRFALFVRSNALAESGAPPTTAELAEMSKFNDSLEQAGILVSGNLAPSSRGVGLLASSRGARLSYTPSGNPDDVKVEQGPFPANTLVAGFWVIKAKDLNEAVAWARKVPFKAADAVVEVRQIAGVDDFGDVFAPALTKREEE